MFNSKKTRTKMLSAGSSDLFLIPEGQTLTITGAASTTGTVSIIDSTGLPALLQSFGVGLQPQFGPYISDQTLSVRVVAGSVACLTADASIRQQVVILSGGNKVNDVITATPGSGYNFTGGQFAVGGVNKGGANVLTYTRQTADVGLQVTFTPSAFTYSGTAGATNAVVPDAPTIGTAVAGNGQVGVLWTPPVNNGGSAITGYVVSAYDSTGALVGTQDAIVSPWPFTGLTNGKSYTFKVAATNIAGTGPQSSASNAVTPSSNFLFARPSSGIFDASQPLTVVPGTSTPMTSANSASGYRSTTDANDIEVEVMNFWALIGNSNEVPSNVPLTWTCGIEVQNPNGSFRAVQLLANGLPSLTLPANTISTGKFRVDTPILKDTNFRVKLYVTHADGVSPIQYPAHSNTDFNGDTLGPGSGEGARFNFADLTMVLNGTGGWQGKSGSYINRPLKVTCSGASAAPRGVTFTGDSLTSGARSAAAVICHNANIPFINLARSGESQRDWPERAMGRARALGFCKTFFCGEVMNSFGAGLEVAKAASLALWAQARAAGHTTIIQMTATPDTSLASTGSTGWATEAQQNPQGPARPAFNAWLRSMLGQPDGPTVLWDFASVTATADGLKNKGGYTYDGIHFTQVGIDAIVAAAAAGNWQADIM